MGFPSNSAGQDSACSAGDPVQFLGWKIPWRREQLPTPVFWPGKFHGQRGLEGYSPWGHKESDVTECLSHSLSFCY